MLDREDAVAVLTVRFSPFLLFTVRTLDSADPVHHGLIKDRGAKFGTLEEATVALLNLKVSWKIRTRRRVEPKADSTSLYRTTLCRLPTST